MDRNRLHTSGGMKWIGSMRSKKDAARKKTVEAEFKVVCGSGMAKNEWLWCRRCHRTYKASEFRNLASDGKIFPLCHYKDCSGDLPIDSRCWSILRENNAALPETPKRGRVYDL